MNYDEYGKMRDLEDRYWWFVARRQLALDLLNNYSPDSKSILDIGCGTGAVLTELNKTRTAYGADFSPQALTFSHQRGLPRLTLADAQALPYKSNSFDSAISLDTLEHVPNDQKAAAEIYRVLKPGATFVMNVPAFNWLWGPHDEALMHHRRYTKNQVSQLLTNQGFTIQKISYSVFFLFPIVAIKRLLEKTHTGPPKVKLPQVSKFSNQSLITLMNTEAKIFKSTNLPWGSSVVAVAQKPNQPQ